MPEEESYKLKIDYLIRQVYTDEFVREWGRYKQELDVPFNTQSSGAEPELYQSDTSEEGDKTITKLEMLTPELARKNFDVSLLKT